MCDPLLIGGALMAKKSSAFKAPKPDKQDPAKEMSVAMRQLELSRAGQGSTTRNNPTGGLGVPNASVAMKGLSA